MAGPDPFAAIAPFYDWEHGDFQDDLPLYLALARRYGGPVLELACGTGRLVLPLAAAGFDVVGLDRSPAMLALARAKLDQAQPPARARLEQAELTRFALPERFGLAVLALDGLGLLRTRDEQLAALALVRGHLRPGGRLVLDLQNGNLRGGEPREELVHQLTRPDPATGRPVTKWTLRRTSPAEQLDTLTYLYDETLPDGLVRRTIAELRLRYFCRFELELLLGRAGFAVEALYGGYDLEPYADDSERLVAVARPA
jgi:SAM-dependent methyltransferase